MPGVKLEERGLENGTERVNKWRPMPPRYGGRTTFCFMTDFNFFSKMFFFVLLNYSRTRAGTPDPAHIAKPQPPVCHRNLLADSQQDPGFLRQLLCSIEGRVRSVHQHRTILAPNPTPDRSSTRVARRQTRSADPPPPPPPQDKTSHHSDLTSMERAAGRVFWCQNQLSSPLRPIHHVEPKSDLNDLTNTPSVLASSPLHPGTTIFTFSREEHERTRHIETQPSPKLPRCVRPPSVSGVCTAADRATSTQRPTNNNPKRNT